MNVLLVDDDFYVTKGLELKINWERLSVESIFIAHNARKAKEILQTTPIDIMICDIEMPQESGLDLLAWMRENSYLVQTIFLTSYADFNYAKRALELESIEYFLKPVDYNKLEDGILKAINKVLYNKKQEEHEKYSRFWMESKHEIIGDFWRKLIFECDVNEADLNWWISSINTVYSMNEQFVPIHIDLFDKLGEFDKWRKTLLSSALGNIIKEQFSLYSVEAVLIANDKSWNVIVKSPVEVNEIKKIKEQSLELIHRIIEELKMDANIYIGRSVNLMKFNEQLALLKEVSSNCIDKRNKVFEISEYQKRTIEYRIPAVGLWETLIEEGKKEALLDNIQLYLRDLVNKQNVNRDILKLIKQDVIQMVYHHLREKQISAHKLFSTEENERLYKNADNSVEDLQKYFAFMIERALEYSNFTGKSASVIEQLKNYLDQNFQKEISRNDLSELVYLNHDYISRLFSKEVGISISGYLMEKRIEKACELLSTSGTSINEISSYVGYSNYSYFTKIFKERMGCSPKEYRKLKISEQK